MFMRVSRVSRSTEANSNKTVTPDLLQTAARTMRGTPSWFPGEEPDWGKKKSCSPPDTVLMIEGG